MRRTILSLYRAYRSGGWYIRPAYRISKLIKKWNIDLVHTNTILCIDGALAAKYRGVPHVQHIREAIGLEDHVATFRMPFQGRKKLFRKLMGYLHARAIANSGFIRDLAQDYFPEGVLKMIYNPVQGLGKSSSIAFYEKESKVIRVGLIANVTAQWKNHPLFIEVARAFFEKYDDPRIKFCIYGKVPSENNPYFQHLKTTISDYNLTSRLEFKGVYTDVEEMFGELAVMVHTTPREPFGRVFIEAMNFGVPIVAAKGGGASELLGENERGILVDEKDLPTFTESINELIYNSVKRKELIESGRAYVKRFETNIIGEQIVSEYQDILTQRR